MSRLEKYGKFQDTWDMIIERLLNKMDALEKYKEADLYLMELEKKEKKAD